MSFLANSAEPFRGTPSPKLWLQEDGAGFGRRLRAARRSFPSADKAIACLIGFMADVDGEVNGWGHSLFTGFATARR
jgi:hypothetical protein